MKIIPYGHQYIDKNDIKAVVDILKSDWLTQGPQIKKFESALCQYTGAHYAVVVSSGTAALHLACLGAGIKPSNEVITSPITFVASSNSILYCGGKPVFADIQGDSINVDPEEIKRRFTKKTKAIIPVHFAGCPCDLSEIHHFAKNNKLIVIEDAAHALGAEYKGSKIGSCKYSDMTILSFHPVKSITTGEGGAVLTNRKDLYEKLLLLRSHGITRDKNRMKARVVSWHYEMQLLGFNYRITDFQCALGVSQLKKLNRFIKRRREIAAIYNQEFKNNYFFDLPIEKEKTKSSWHIYPIRLKENHKKAKEKIYFQLRKKGIGVQVHYIPVYLQPFYKKIGYRKGSCPKAEDFYQREISIPIYPALTNKDVEYVINSIKSILKKMDKK